MDYTYPIWLFFAAFFFYFAYAHWREGEVQIRPFTIRSRGQGSDHSALDEATEEFVRSFNDNLAQTNRSARRRHRAAAVGYGLSGLIALASMFMIMVGRLTG
jgi:hypothetical protein